MENTNTPPADEPRDLDAAVERARQELTGPELQRALGDAEQVADKAAGRELLRSRFRSARQLRRLAQEAGLGAPRIQGVVYYPPVGALARALGPLDPWAARLLTLGAAFLVLTAGKGDG